MVFGELSQAQSCLQKRLVSELPLTCGRRPRAASDLRAATAWPLRSMRTVSQHQRALSRTNMCSASSSSHTSEDMGTVDAAAAVGRAE